ncbi:MAG: OmpA family protein [Flavobacterium sp.]
MIYVRYIIVFLLFSATMIAQEQFTLYFDFNQELPNAASTDMLNAWISSNSNAKIIAIHGFADAADSDAYNYKLSSKRIKNVANKLKAAGLRFLDEVVIKSYGETEASGNDTEDRKVVVWYVLPPVEKKPAEPVKIPRKPLEAAQFTKGKHIVLEGLLFFPDTDVIIPESTGALAELAAIMINNPKLKIQIHGHMCCAAKDRTNLSGDRATMVYETLRDKGVGPGRITYRGYGTTRPLYKIPEKNEAERLANRRVEIVVVEN